MKIKSATPKVGMEIIASKSAANVTIREVVPTMTKAGETIFRLRVTPMGYTDHPDRSRWVTVSHLVNFGSGWVAAWPYRP